MDAFDVLDNEGFLDSLPYTYRIIYLRINTGMLLPSWIVFQYFCLNVEGIRFLVQAHDYEPFEGRAFRFRVPYNQLGLGEIPEAFGRLLWKNLFPMWASCTLHHPYFEVFRTPSMGLGLRSLVDTTFLNMASEVHGFLDFITDAEEAQTLVFHQLALANHPSLYWGLTEEHGIQNAILFGPLSLCNSNEWIGGNLNPQIIQFVNFHPNGIESHWRLTYSWGIERALDFVGTDDQMEIQFPYHCVDFQPVDVEDPIFHEDVDYTHAEPKYVWEILSTNTAVSFPHRVFFSAMRQVDEENIVYNVT